MEVKMGNGSALAALMAGIASGAGPSTLKAASMVQIRALLEGTSQPAFQIGDIVQLRPDIGHNYRFPQVDEKSIVTQVLEKPYRTGDSSSTESADRKTIALAFIDEAEEGRIAECLYDGRHFVKVGSIYDPVTMPDGSEIPVC